MEEMNADAYLKRAIESFEKGEYDHAITDASEAIRLNPNDALAYGTRGGAYKAKKDFDKAIADLTEAIRLDPNNASAYGNRGLTYLAKEDESQAVSDLEMAVKIDPQQKSYQDILRKIKTVQSNDSSNLDDKIITSPANKAKIIVTTIFSIAGLIIGICIAVSNLYDGVAGFFTAWILLGFGGNLIVAITEDLDIYVGAFNDSRRQGGSFFGTLGISLAVTILWLLLKSLAGPIFPIIQIVRWSKNE